MPHPTHETWLRRIREDLRLGHMPRLEASINEIGLEFLLAPEFLAHARHAGAPEVLVLIATLGAANRPEAANHERLLAAYQCMLGQVTSDVAAERCAQAVSGSEASYKVLLQCLDLRSPSPDLSGLKPRSTDLRFGIELLVDAKRADCITPLLQAWQKIDRSDLPWLRTCHALVARTEHVYTSAEAGLIAQSIEQLLKYAPRRQEAVKQEMRIQLMKMWLKCRNGERAFAAAKRAYEKERSAEVRFSMARALMMKGQLQEALIHVDAVLVELAQAPEARMVLEQPVQHSFDVAAAEDSLRSANRLLRAEGLRPFLMSGTLLGYEREGALLAHDKDVDLGLLGWEHQFSVANALLKSGYFYLDLSHLTGSKRFLITAHDMRNGMAVDFFFFHDRGDHYLHGIDSAVGFTQNFKFSKFGLRDVPFLGDTFSVPDDIDRNLSENYGNWRSPATSYVVTVESPALSTENPFSRQLWVNLELLRTITKGFKPVRAQRILDHVDAHNLPFISPAARVAVEAWIRHGNAVAMAKAA